MPERATESGGVLSNGTGLVHHGFQSLREFNLPRSSDELSFLGPGHAVAEEFHVLGGLRVRLKTPRHKTQDARGRDRSLRS